MLEGIEVVFIIIAIGAGGPLLLPASMGAGLALLVVVGLGLVVHRPLARVPENTLKFGVGIVLAAFGNFWVGEGIGLSWPGAEWAVLALIALHLFIAIALVSMCKHVKNVQSARSVPMLKAGGLSAALAGRFTAVLFELWGLFVDDVWLALGTLVLVAATAPLQQVTKDTRFGECCCWLAG